MEYFAIKLVVLLTLILVACISIENIDMILRIKQTKIIILTLIIASAAAIIKPVQPESLLKEEVSEYA